MVIYRRQQSKRREAVTVDLPAHRTYLFSALTGYLRPEGGLKRNALGDAYLLGLVSPEQATLVQPLRVRQRPSLDRCACFSGSDTRVLRHSTARPDAFRLPRRRTLVGLFHRDLRGRITPAGPGSPPLWLGEDRSRTGAMKVLLDVCTPVQVRHALTKSRGLNGCGNGPP